MIKLKPTNIFQYYAPTCSIPKIANFSNSTNRLSSTLATSASEIIPATSLPKAGKKDNTWIFILLGVSAVGIGLYVHHCYVKRRSIEEEEGY